MADNFYFQGKFFETQEEFWKYVEEWPYQQTDHETIERLMDGLKRQLLLNLEIYKPKITNGKLNLVIDEVFMLMIKSLIYSQIDNINLLKSPMDLKEE